MAFFKSKLFAFKKSPPKVTMPQVKRFRSLPPNLSNGLPRNGAKILINRFSYAGRDKQLSPPYWNQLLGEKNEEWQRAVYGFVWLDDLAAHGGDITAQKAREILIPWLEQHQAIDADELVQKAFSAEPENFGWRFHIIAARHARLLRRAFLIFSHDPPAELREKLLSYLAKEATLLTHIPFYDGKLETTPFLRTLIAGTLSALCVDGYQNHLNNLINRLNLELDEFILADGMVANRALNDLVRIFFDLVGLRRAFEHAKTPFPIPFTQKIEKMASCIRMMRHSDGMLALYHGARDGRNDVIDAALEHANSALKTPNLLPLGGYGAIKKNKFCAFMDMGGVPKNPDHSKSIHASPLAIEVSHGSHRLITNCGGVAINHEELRKVSRHGAAHSTIIINNTDPINLKTIHKDTKSALMIQHERIDQEGEVWLSAWHEGYDKNFQSVVKRQLYMNDEGQSLLGEDHISASQENYPFHIRFHLHPDIQVEAQDTPNLFKLYHQNGKFWWFEVEGVDCEIAPSVYLAGTKPLIHSQQIVLTGMTGDLDRIVNWVLEYDSSCDII